MILRRESTIRANGACAFGMANENYHGHGLLAAAGDEHRAVR